MLNFKMRIYPTREQQRRLEETCEINRGVYNYFVLNRFRSRNDMNYSLTELKEQQPVLRKCHSKMLQMISTKVAGAQSALDELKKRGAHQSGYGKLQLLKPGECNSFTYNQSGYRVEPLPDGKCMLWLSRIGRIEIRVHRKVYDIAQVIIVRQAGKWYAVLSCKVSRGKQCSLRYEKTVGIDVGIKNYAYDSDGHHVDNPLFLTKELKPLRRAQRKVSRRKKGSNNHKKAVSWLQRLHMRIANKRKNFLHKLSDYCSGGYDVIFLERLKPNNMVIKNHCLARHIMDSGWGTFKQMEKYKANRAMEVDPYNTTVDSSRCGNKVPKTLAIRIHECDVCGAVLDRDHNSSMVIDDRGRMMLGLPMRHREVTPAEIPSGVKEAGTSPQALAVGS